MPPLPDQIQQRPGHPPSEELLYLELDGTFLRYHQGAEKKEPSSLPQAIVLMGHEFFSISVLVTENPTRTGRGSYRRWWLVA